MTTATEGWHGYVRLKLDNDSNNWSNASFGYPRDPLLNSAPFDTSVGMEKIFVIGSRTSVDTVEGVIDITGSLERGLYSNLSDNQIVWSPANGSHLALADVSGLYGGNVSKLMMLVKPNDNMTYVHHGMKTHDYSLGFAQGEITTESVSYTTDNISKN